MPCVWNGVLMSCDNWAGLFGSSWSVQTELTEVWSAAGGEASEGHWSVEKKTFALSRPLTFWPAMSLPLCSVFSFLMATPARLYSVVSDRVSLVLLAGPKVIERGSSNQGHFQPWGLHRHPMSHSTPALSFFLFLCVEPLRQNSIKVIFWGIKCPLF